MNSTALLISGFLACLPWIDSSAQDFLNNDLDGIIVGSTSLPTDWQEVPHTDPVCLANYPAGATPNLTGPDGPSVVHGIMGNPYSGDTFVSSLRGTAPDHIDIIWDEGIQQTVDGFLIGQEYTIGFYQTVVKQSWLPFLDTSGSWAVYLDTLLIGISTPTSSQEPAISLNLPWEFRSMPFTATATSHLIKFLPRDDDPLVHSPYGLRMGIDSIFISADPSLNMGMHRRPLPTLAPNPTSGLFTIDPGNAASYRVEIRELIGRVVLVSERVMEGPVLIDAGALAKGIYFINTVSNEMRSPSIKLVIE